MVDLWHNYSESERVAELNREFFNRTNEFTNPVIRPITPIYKP